MTFVTGRRDRRVHVVDVEKPEFTMHTVYLVNVCLVNSAQMTKLKFETITSPNRPLARGNRRAWYSTCATRTIRT